MITVQDLVRKMHHNFIHEVNSIELIGNVKEFGHYLINGTAKATIYIFDEERLMDVAQDMMNNFKQLSEAESKRVTELYLERRYGYGGY